MEPVGSMPHSQGLSNNPYIKNTRCKLEKNNKIQSVEIDFWENHWKSLKIQMVIM